MIRRELFSWDGADGWIGEWLICGFFENGLVPDDAPNLMDRKVSKNWEADELGAWGGESEIKEIPEKTGKVDVEWLPVSLAYGPKLDLGEIRERYLEIDSNMEGMKPETWDKSWYALAVLEAKEDTDAALKFCGWDGCRLFINGELLFEDHSWHKAIPEKESVDFKLKKGVNTVLLKLDRGGCLARVEIRDGTPVSDIVQNVTTAEPPAPVRISTIQQLKRWALEKSVKMPFTGKTPAELSSWQETFRNHYHSCLGEFPSDIEDPLELIRTDYTDDGVERRLYHMLSEANSVVPFYLLIPPEKIRNGKMVTVAHGHSTLWEEVVGVKMKPGPRMNAVGPYTEHYGLDMAREGFVVCVCCERGFSDRSDYKGSLHVCNVGYMMAMAQGACYAALHMHDIRRMTDQVMKLPELKGFSGPGLMGLSAGGTLTYLLGAYDDKFKACATFCGICRYRDYALNGGCGMQTVPNLYPTGDVGELLSLIAPRPLLIAQGKLDTTFNVVTVRSVVEDVQAAYDAVGTPGNIQLHLFDLAHQVDVGKASSFFNENL